MSLFARCLPDPTNQFCKRLVSKADELGKKVTELIRAKLRDEAFPNRFQLGDYLRFGIAPFLAKPAVANLSNITWVKTKRLGVMNVEW
ncbi:2253_t:CDS:2 [Entrophospora sp. SA101]|nr:2253_t:CDS:2 [Entrophospora sp. SA101]